ncbi:MAG: PadR family transcriptional regulator [Vicinamibacterales bacterium]
MDEPRRFLPLTPQQFHILLALTGGRLHGYAIIREVADRTEGALRLGTGTLYTALARFEALALVEETDRRPVPAKDDERRRYYRLTAAGKAVLRAETARLETLVRHARQKGVLAVTRPQWSRAK